MGKPLDPSYFRKYRATHPEYAARDRARARKRTRKPRDRTAEYAKRRRPPAPEPLAPPTDLLVRRESLLLEDLAQERELAKLERKDPDAAVRAYRRREHEFIYRTRALTIYQLGDHLDDDR